MVVDLSYAVDGDSGLILPRGLVAERARAEQLERGKAEVERRRKGERDRAIRRDGRLRKGKHTNDRYRRDAMKRRGKLKGIVGPS